MNYKFILLGALCLSITSIIYKRIQWIVVKHYYRKKNNCIIAILEVDTLQDYSNTVTKLNKSGFELINECVIPFSLKKYKLIFKKTI